MGVADGSVLVIEPLPGDRDVLGPNVREHRNVAVFREAGDAHPEVADVVGHDGPVEDNPGGILGQAGTSPADHGPLEGDEERGVVADITHTVAIEVRLIGIGDVRTVVAIARDTVVVLIDGPGLLVEERAHITGITVTVEVGVELVGVVGVGAVVLPVEDAIVVLVAVDELLAGVPATVRAANGVARANVGVVVGAVAGVHLDALLVD